MEHAKNPSPRKKGPGRYHSQGFKTGNKKAKRGFRRIGNTTQFR